MINIMQLLLNGVIEGSIYALIAVGFSLIYNTERFFDLSNGSVYATAAFLAFSLNVFAGFPLIIALLIAIGFGMALGVGINYVIFRPLKKKNASNFSLILASFGIFFFFEGLILLIFGSEVKTFGIAIETGYNILGGRITALQIILLIVSIIVMIGIYLFIRNSKIGKALRAVSDNKKVAQTLGIDIDKTTLIVYAIGSGLASLAGVLVGMEHTLNPGMGFMAVIKGIVSAIIGGIGNIPASVAGGFILGLTENIGIVFLPSGFKDAISCVILIVFLLFRPQGFFGTKKRGDVENA